MWFPVSFHCCSTDSSSGGFRSEPTVTFPHLIPGHLGGTGPLDLSPRNGRLCPLRPAKKTPREFERTVRSVQAPKALCLGFTKHHGHVLFSCSFFFSFLFLHSMVLRQAAGLSKEACLYPADWLSSSVNQSVARGHFGCKPRFLPYGIID